MELHSIFLSANIEPEKYHSWLQSSALKPQDFDDWPQMSPQWDQSWNRYFQETKNQSIAELLESWQNDEYNQSPLLLRYNSELKLFTLFQTLFEENLINIATTIAQLRGIQDFCMPSPSSYILVAPLFLEEGITSVLEINRGGSRFLSEDMTPINILEAANHLLAEQLRAIPDD